MDALTNNGNFERSPHLEGMRCQLYALQRKHGPTSSASHHASNIIELMKLPNPPARLLKVQMDGLQRALAMGEQA